MNRRLDKRSCRTEEFCLQNIMYLLYGDPHDLNSYEPLFHKINTTVLKQLLPEKQISNTYSILHPEIFSVYFSFFDNEYQEDFHIFFNSKTINLNDHNRIFFDLHYGSTLKIIDPPDINLFSSNDKMYQGSRRNTISDLLKPRIAAAPNKGRATGVRKSFVENLTSENFQNLVVINENILKVWQVGNIYKKITLFIQNAIDASIAADSSTCSRTIFLKKLQKVVIHYLNNSNYSHAIVWLLIAGILFEDTEHLTLFHSALSEIDNITRKEASDLKRVRQILFLDDKHRMNDAKYKHLLSQTHSPRLWIENSLQENVKNHNHPVIVLTGFPGSGKSHFIAHYIDQNPMVAAYFFCEWNSPSKNDSTVLIKEISIQLALKLPGFSQKLQDSLKNETVESILQWNLSHLFEVLICEPLYQISIQSDKVLIVIDALDELKDAIEFAYLLQDHSYKLPPQISILLSTRQNHHLLHLLHALPGFYMTNLHGSPQNVYDDIYSFLKSELNQPDDFLQTLTHKCNGNFLYAKYICSEIKRNPDKTEHILETPFGMTALYHQYFRRYFPDLEQYNKHCKDAFAIILAVEEPLNVSQFQSILQWSERQTFSFIDLISGLLISDVLPQKIMFYHKSIYDWLQSYEKSTFYYIDPKIGHQKLFAEAYRQYQKDYTSMDYHLIKYWNRYALETSDHSARTEMLDNIDFQLWTAEELRRHSEFSKALSTVQKIINLYPAPYSEAVFKAKLILNDIYLDLEEDNALPYTYELLEENSKYEIKNSYLLIHLYENAGLQYMLEQKYEDAEKVLNQALAIYNDILLSLEKRKRYSHTLYILGNILYRQKKYAQCKDTIQQSLDFLADCEPKEHSLSYALNLKLLAWIDYHQHDFTSAIQSFREVIAIELHIYGENSLYVANTYCDLAEILLRLYQQTSSFQYVSEAKNLLAQSHRIYQEILGDNYSRLQKIQTLRNIITELETPH